MLLFKQHTPGKMPVILSSFCDLQYSRTVSSKRKRKWGERVKEKWRIEIKGGRGAGERGGG
jgi:hypothetical protein